ncbi:Amino-acid permease gap5 [Komagataella kurtzmanii]|nr:Amino-acid permease gap5 [Komagataella kurtzmanii]
MKEQKEVEEKTKDLEADDVYHSIQGDVKQDFGFFSRFIDSFKPMPSDENDSDMDTGLTDAQRTAIKTARNPMKQKLKSRHLQLITIGGSIGTGLFIGTGSALHTGGPAAVLIAWTLTGTMLYCTIQALGELASTFPRVLGGFNTYASRFVDPALGFAVSWNYMLQWLVLLPLELVASSMTIKYWNTSVHPDIWVAIFYVFIVVVNLFGVKGYAEVECAFSLLKIIAIVGFIILGIVLCAGGAPNGLNNGAKYYYDPGAFAAGFKGVCSTFITSAFSLAGTEFIGLTATETLNPRKTLPSATKQVFWRILLFYMVSLTIITFLVPSNDPRLLGASSDASVSPFAMAIEAGGISGLPSVINAVILISILGVANTSVYATSRVLLGLSASGHAPKILSFVDRAGRPMAATAVTLVFGLLAFIAASEKEDEVFTWLLSISGMSAIFTWLLICFSHIRFRSALKAQGHNVEDLTFVSQSGAVGSWYGVGVNVLIFVVTFWVSLFPIGEGANVESFFESYLGFVVFWACYFGYKLWRKDFSFSFVPLETVDIQSGRVDMDVELLKEEIRQEKEFIRSQPFYYRTYKFWC